jgi:hypothetical protein
MFKYPFLMGIPPLPAPDTTHISHINMIFSSTSGSLGSFDPWVVPHPEDVDLYGVSMLCIMVDIVDPTVPLTFIDTGQQLHPHVECDHLTLLVWVADSLGSHDFLDTKFPLEEAILEDIDFIDKPWKDEHHRESILPDLELKRVSIMSSNMRLGALARTSSRPLSFDPFSPQISFSELATEYSAFPLFEDSCCLPPSCIDGSHQEAFITHKTIHVEYLQTQTFIPMWHGPDMVCSMMPPMTHKFIEYAKYPWPEPSNRLSFF